MKADIKKALNKINAEKFLRYKISKSGTRYASKISRKFILAKNTLWRQF